MLEEFHQTAAEIFILRGFNATDLYFVTSQGYILNIVRATNPLFNDGRFGLPGREPLFFVHGTTTDAQGFLINSRGAKPRDYSKLMPENMSLQQMQSFLKDDPNSKSLAFTALCFGHEVYMLNRRGTQYSLGHTDPNKQPFVNSIAAISNLFGINLKSVSLHEVLNDDNLSDIPATLNRNMLTANIITQAASNLAKPLAQINYLTSIHNPKYWDYSLDEQAECDIPEAVEFILELSSCTKLIYIGHSAGGALGLMALTINATLNDKG